MGAFFPKASNLTTELPSGFLAMVSNATSDAILVNSGSCQVLQVAILLTGVAMDVPVIP
jgi:hypothetical protein